MGCLLCLRPCNRLVAGYPLLLVYSRLDQARIDRERFVPNQPGRNAHCHYTLEDPTQSIALPEAFVPRTAEYRVIGDQNRKSPFKAMPRNEPTLSTTSE
jgi:hypothetical protein